MNYHSIAALLLFTYPSVLLAFKANALPRDVNTEPVCLIQNKNGAITDLSSICGKESKEVKMLRLVNDTIDTENKEKIKPLKDCSAILASQLTEYTDFKSVNTVKDIQMKGDRAVMLVIETSSFTFDIGHCDPQAPKATESQIEHQFTLNNDNGAWKIVGHSIKNGLTNAATNYGLPLVNIASARNQAIDTVQSAWSFNAEPEDSSDLVSFLEPVNKHNWDTLNLDGVEKPMLLAQSASLDRNAIVDYATKYWKNYNPNYRNFAGSGQGGDCTNFVSQALNSGRWPQNSGLYTSTNSWWYNWGNQTRTWINAHYFYWFMSNSRRGTITTNMAEVQKGDIIQADFDRNGTMDHAMIVTAKDSRGALYLTYHSNNELNKAFSSMPPGNYWVWKLKNSIP